MRKCLLLPRCPCWNSANGYAGRKGSPDRRLLLEISLILDMTHLEFYL